MPPALLFEYQVLDTLFVFVLMHLYAYWSETPLVVVLGGSHRLSIIKSLVVYLNSSSLLVCFFLEDSPRAFVVTGRPGAHHNVNIL